MSRIGWPMNGFLACFVARFSDCRSGLTSAIRLIRAALGGKPGGKTTTLMWYGRRDQWAGRRGGPQDMCGLYERLVDSRAAGFRNPEQCDSISTLGHAGRVLQGREAERALAGSHVQRSEVGDAVAHCVRGQGGARQTPPGTPSPRRRKRCSRRRWRRRSGRATTPPWPTCGTRLAVPGLGTTAAPPAGGWAPTPGLSRSFSTTHTAFPGTAVGGGHQGRHQPGRHRGIYRRRCHRRERSIVAGRAGPLETCTSTRLVAVG
ncbi:hypothetical protein F5883DRAFT_565807 [Diaporthe sp. PMI_573]|nr:hypothetical protein F5883DRAFT_565807 [Diaporthaceae sp. PMI_573]